MLFLYQSAWLIQCCTCNVMYISHIGPRYIYIVHVTSYYDHEDVTTTMIIICHQYFVAVVTFSNCFFS